MSDSPKKKTRVFRLPSQEISEGTQSVTGQTLTPRTLETPGNKNSNYQMFRFPLHHFFLIPDVIPRCERRTLSCMIVKNGQTI